MSTALQTIRRKNINLIVDGAVHKAFSWTHFFQPNRYWYPEDYPVFLKLRIASMEKAWEGKEAPRYVVRTDMPWTPDGDPTRFQEGQRVYRVPEDWRGGTIFWDAAPDGRFELVGTLGKVGRRWALVPN